MITENTLRTKIEVTADGQLKATLDGVAQSVEKIDKAQQGQAESAAAAATAGQANAAATQAVGESAAEAEARIKAMVQASLERQRVEQAQITASMRSVDTTKVATQTINEQVAAHQKAIAAADAYRERSAAASKAASNTAGLDAQRDAMHKLLGEIDPTITSLDKLDKQQAKLAGFKKAGLLGADDFARFSQAIDGSRNRITAAGEAMSHFSLNTAQSRRELGYLVKDLATGQYGRLSQTSLTLAANTGIMGAAFSAAGVAIIGTTALLAAYAIGAGEAYLNEQKLNQAIAQTGNFAGVTMGEVNGLASGLGTATGKAGLARDILLALAADGKVGAESYAALGQAAFDMAQLTGKSAAEAASATTQMFDGTAAGALKANEQYHFLTDATYDHIKALQEEGRAQEAAQVAAEAFHDAVGPRIAEMESQVYGLARAWDSVAASTKGWWEEFKTGSALIAGTADITTQYYAQLGRVQGEIEHFGSASFGQQEKLDKLKAQMEAAIARTDQQAAQTRLNNDAVTGSTTIDRLSASVDKADAKKQKLAELSAAFDKLWGSASPDNARLAGVQRLVGADGSVSFAGGEYDRLKAAIETQGTPKGRRAPDLSIDIPVPSLDKSVEGYQKELDAQAKVTVALQDYRQVQEAKLRTTKEALDLQVASIGMGDREIAMERELIGIHRESDADLQRLNKQRASMTQDQYNEQLSMIKEFENARVEAAHAADERILAAQGNWRNGMESALQNYADRAADVAGQVRDVSDKSFEGMSDYAADRLSGIKGNFSGMVDSIIHDLLRMESRVLVSQVLQSVLGAFMGSYGAEGTNTYSSIGTDSSGGSINFVSHVGGRANGGRIDGPGTGTSDSILARVSTGENVITASATDYYGQSFMDALNAKQVPRFASGGRVGGGGGAGSLGAPEVVVNITNNGQSVQAQQTGVRMDGQKMIIDLVLQAVQGDIAKGGGTAQAMQQRFGLRRRGVPVGG